MRLAYTKPFDIYQIARNTCFQPLIARLSDDNNDYVRFGVAWNTNTSQEILAKLSYDNDANVRYYVALNKNTPKEVLTKLSDDNHDYVKRIAKESLRNIK